MKYIERKQNIASDFICSNFTHLAYEQFCLDLRAIENIQWKIFFIIGPNNPNGLDLGFGSGVVECYMLLLDEFILDLN